MPILHEFSRTAAALGTALALVVLPLVGTVAAPDPAQATIVDGNDTVVSINIPSRTPAGTSDPSANGSSTGDNPSAGDNGETPRPAAPVTDPPPSPAPTDPDPACKNDPKPVEGEPCEAAHEPITALWESKSDTTGSIKLPTGPSADDPSAGFMPQSWVGQGFDGPQQNRAMSRKAAPRSTNGTDDSGNPTPPQAAASTPAPYTLNPDGYVVHPDDPTTPIVFEGTTTDWKFSTVQPVDDTGKPTGPRQIEVAGTPLNEAGGGAANKDADATTQANASTSSSADGGTTSSDGTTSGSTADSSASADTGTADAGTAGTADSSASGAGAAADGSGTSSTPGAATSTNTGTATASGTTASATDSNGTSTDASAANANATASGTAAADGATASANGSDTAKGTSNANGTADGTKTTPDPSTGNGSADIRNVIPGNVGPDWLPGGGDDTKQPDYSDPVPRNPEAKAPDDNTDLITGGTPPSPRSESPSNLNTFSESITSTIASSWPVLVLAALGMAAVGFIIFLVGKRKKQD